MVTKFNSKSGVRPAFTARFSANLIQISARVASSQAYIPGWRSLDGAGIAAEILLMAPKCRP